MNVQVLGVTSVTPTHCVPTLRDLMSVAVLKVLRGMVKPAQVKYEIFSRNICPKHAHFIFEHAISTLVKSCYFISSVHFLILATAEPVCDPSCNGNKVCQNYSGDPECVCADGFTGEDICIGILDSVSTYLNYLL